MRNDVNRRLHLFFQNVFAKPAAGERLLEVGCARSIWLPYFARTFGLDVYGLDYSEDGCRQEEALLDKAGVKGVVVHADLFDPPPALLESFDYVVTFGVVEHFQDPTVCIDALAKYLRPGGKLLTLVPNMHGSVGTLQRFLDRNVFDIHVPLDADALRFAHESAGLAVISCDYFISTSYYVVNVANRSAERGYRFLRLLYRLCGRLSMAVWLLERLVGELPASRAFSPYVICLASKPA